MLHVLDLQRNRLSMTQAGRVCPIAALPTEGVDANASSEQ